MLSCSSNWKNYYENYYYNIIDLLHQYFGENNVYIILQEKLRSNKKQILNKLNKFIGTKKINKFNNSILNSRRGLSLNTLETLRKLNNFFIIKKETIYNKKKVLLPLIIFNNIFVRGLRFFDYVFPKKFKKSKKELLSIQIIEKISEMFSEDNKKLQKYFKYDISKYGYK